MVKIITLVFKFIKKKGEQTVTITIQQTSKKLKLHLIISTIMVMIGVVGAIAVMPGNLSPNEAPSPIWGLSLLCGFVWFIVTKIRIWWDHK